MGLTAQLYAIDAAAGHMVEALPPRDIGKEVYQKHCIGCHHYDLKGVSRSPLGMALSQKYTVKELIEKLKKGCPDNPYAPYDFLKMYELVKVSRYIQQEHSK